MAKTEKNAEMPAARTIVNREVTCEFLHDFRINFTLKKLFIEKFILKIQK